MSENIIIDKDSPASLNTINDFVHDNYFDKDLILFEGSKLVIPFLREEINEKKLIKKIWVFKKYSIPKIRYYLRINNVKKYLVEEGKYKEKWDLFNILKYNPEDKIILIESCISTNIKVWVSRFEISIIRDKMVGEISSVSIF